MRARRLEVLVDGPLLRRVTAAADAAGVTNYRLMPTIGGRGPHGQWHADHLTDATDKVVFVTILPPDRADALVAALSPLLDDFDLILTVGDVDVVRGEVF